MLIGNEAIVKHEQYHDLQQEAAVERLIRQAHAPRQGSALLAWLLTRVQAPVEGVPVARRSSLVWHSEEPAAL